MELSEEQIAGLLKKIASGEPKTSDPAMMTLYLAFNKPVRNFIWASISQDSTLVEEVTQDTFTEVWKYPGRFRGESKFKVWLFSIAKYKALDYLRKHNKNFVPLDTGDQEIPSGEMPVIDLIYAGQVKKAFLTCLETLMTKGKLSMQHKQVLYLAYTEDQSLNEIATVLNGLENTIKTQLYYARFTLRNCLQRKLYGGGSHG